MDQFKISHTLRIAVNLFQPQTVVNVYLMKIHLNRFPTKSTSHANTQVILITPDNSSPLVSKVPGLSGRPSGKTD